MNQVKEKMKLLEGLDCPVILNHHIPKHCGRGKVFIYDEYYHVLKKQKLMITEFGKEKQLDHFFTLGQSERLIAVTGHYSEHFLKFIKEF